MLFSTLIQPSTQSIKHLFQRIQSYILPTVCVLCGNLAHSPPIINLCGNCSISLPILPYHCPQCAQFLPLTIGHHSHCESCLTQAPPFDRTFALFPYEFPIDSLITQLKFQRQLSHALLFGNLLANQISQTWYRQDSLPDLLLPIPLHHSRLRERGFNQAYEIAKPIAQALKLPIDIQHTLRHKPTRTQSSLPARHRKANIQNAFSVSNDYTGLHLAVIDDVITTGHTVREFCRVLKQHGAGRIDVWCCARRG